LHSKKGGGGQKYKPVYFVGAGPGDPELLTIKARRLLDEAHVIVYTGSLVPKTLLHGCRARLFNSAGMHLDQVMEILIKGYRQGLKVVRLHTGDPSLYSAIAEQISLLEKEFIPYQVVPGITSGLAACASLGVELTIPEKVQTVIISRISGRTPVPEKESLEKLSKIQGSLILYLSISHIEKVTKQLSKGYPLDTPVAVVEKASWPEEKIVLGTISNIAQKVKKTGIKKTAVIIVGEALLGIDNPKSTCSRLYCKEFSHGYRKGNTQDTKLIKAFSASPSAKTDLTLIVYLGSKGHILAEQISQKLNGPSRLIRYSELKEDQSLQKMWEQISAIIFVCACQIAVRTIAPFIKDKYTDPAVVAVDESGKNVVCLLSGHLGGGNKLAKNVADILKARPVITTQSDIMELAPIDLWTKAHNLLPTDSRKLKHVQALLRNGDTIKVFIQDHVILKALPEGLVRTKSEDCADIVIGPFIPGPNSNSLHLATRNLCLGTGCHKGLAPDRLFEKMKNFLEKHSIPELSIEKVCTIDKKAKEPAIVELAKYLEATLLTFSSEELNNVTGPETSKVVLDSVGAKAVAEPAAMLCCRDGKLIVKKEKFDCCTFSIAATRVEITDRY